jgi:hypothetical protein
LFGLYFKEWEAAGRRREWLFVVTTKKIRPRRVTLAAIRQRIGESVSPISDLPEIETAR